MKTSVQHIGYGKIEYEENFWSGKRNIIIDGKPLTKKSRNVYTLELENEVLECRVKGSFFFGGSFYIGQDVIQFSESSRWYEIFLSFLICGFVLIWGNVPALCELFPIIGGAIGGAISGATTCCSLFLMKRVKNVPLKLLVWLGIFGITILACYIPGVWIRAISSVGKYM